MIFFMMGMLKTDVRSIPQDIQQLTNDFIGQPLVAIRTAGALRDDAGHRVGMMLLVDLEDRSAADEFMKDSPYLQAHLYENVQVLNYTPEVGW
jgi:uncharacterized protein YciI